MAASHRFKFPPLLKTILKLELDFRHAVLISFRASRENFRRFRSLVGMKHPLEGAKAIPHHPYAVSFHPPMQQEIPFPGLLSSGLPPSITAKGPSEVPLRPRNAVPIVRPLLL